MSTEPISAISHVSHLAQSAEVLRPDLRQPAGVPNPAAVDAFQAALRAAASDGPEVIGGATLGPGERLIDTVGRMERDMNAWIAEVKTLGTHASEGVLDHQQMLAQMLRAGRCRCRCRC
ncbi:hypothetical protein [Pseudoduganella lutea]|uniref:Uncharacterized protein n=1 Tax=Pseudoduganella lutea TaxID=321985 RepID=A0A4P6KS56_9BURK|nr:hypothetical protein [Pseudoduganella lutea]QBE61939.1 hypothetical protein EWM63_02145 [Pseudoduganella lutea]